MEMNMHVPQSIPAATELRILASVLRNIISPRTSSPIIQLFQDTMTGAYRISQAGVTVPEHIAMNILARSKRPFKRKNREWTGSEIISAAMPMINYNARGIKLELGELTKGVLKKSVTGNLIHVAYNDFGPERAGQLINDIQAIVTQFNLYTGFSVGTSDLIADSKTLGFVREKIAEGRQKVANILTNVHGGKYVNNMGMSDGEKLEDDISSAMKDVVNKINTEVIDSLKRTGNTNRIVQMVDSGSKGSEANITQMVATLGQQLIEGKRVQYTLQDRTLPHFTRYDDGVESRGFVEHSFVDGLLPAEFFFHAQAGREGLIDTAVKSVTRDTQVLIQDKTGVTRVVAIGEWIDGLLENAPEESITQYGPEDANMELLRLQPEECVYIPTVDEHGNTSWGELTAVTRHDPGEKLYEVKTQSGRSVTVTAAHSLLVWNEATQTFEQRDAPSVKVGELMPVTANLSRPATMVSSIPVDKYLSKTDHVYGTDFNKAVELMKTAMEGRFHIPTGWWEDNNGKEFDLPYTNKARLQRAVTRSGVVENGRVYPYHASRQHAGIPDVFELTGNNGIFVGLYLADGHCDEISGQVTISKNDVVIREFVKTWFDSMGITWTEIAQSDARAASIQGHSTLLARFLNRLCGSGSANKHVPDEAFAAPAEFQLGVLNGYISGDGTVSDRDLEVSSVSQQLILGISQLCSSIGVFGKLAEVPYPTNTHPCSYRLSIRSQWARRFAEQVTLLHPEKAAKLTTMEATEKHRNFDTQKDVVLDAIVSITPIDPAKHPKMYDVTVPSTLNFGLFNGLQCADTSDTGYIQRRLMKTMEDQHIEYDGTVRNVNGSIVQFHYGEDGVDTVCVEDQTCDLVLKTLENIYAEYALTPADVNPFLKEEVSEAPDMVDEIIADRDLLFRKTFRHKKSDTLQAPVNIQRLLNKYTNPYSTKTDLTPQYVTAAITRLVKEFPNNRNFHTLLRFYLAPKKSIVIHRLTQAIFDELMRDIRFRYIQAQVHAGEMVGALAAQSIGEPTTQLTLNSIAYHERVVCRKNGQVVEMSIGELVEKVIAGAKDAQLEHHANNTTLAYMPEGETWDALSVDEQGVVSWKKLEAVTKHPVVNEDGSNTLVKVQTKGGRTVMATKAKSFLSKAEDGSLQPTRGDELKLGTMVPIGRFETLLPAQPEGESFHDIVWDPVVAIEEVANPTEYVYDLTVADTRNFVHANGLCLRDTFHSAGTAKANATSGVPRIEELLSASSNPKRPSNTVYLNPELMESQDAAVAKMKEIQKTTLRDIVNSIRIFYDPYPLSNSTVIDDDREMLQRYEEFACGEDGSNSSPWILRLEMNEMQMASRNILDMVEIQAKLSANPALKIVECRYSDPMAKNLVMRLMFDAAVVKNPIQLRFLEDKILDTPLTGVPGIGRVFQRRVKNELVYDAQVGGYKPVEQYVLDVEGTNLYDLMVFPGVDATRTTSNDIHEINDVFGIEAARLALYEEINEVFSSEKVNYHHLSVLVDTMTFSGRIVPVNRFGMSKNETGVLAKSSFEETSKIMFNAAMWAEKDSMKGVSANIMFGQKPPCGTGFVDILVDEARLPEGEEEPPEDATLEKVNEKLANVQPTDCRLEDILMEW